MNLLYHFLNNPTVIERLWNALVAFILFGLGLRIRQVWLEKKLKRIEETSEEDKKILERIEEKLDKMGVSLYLDGALKLPKVKDGIQAMDEYKYDEAIGIFRKLLPDAEGSQKVALLSLIGVCLRQQDNLDEALGHCQESLKLAEEIQDKEGIVANLNNRGLVYANKGNYDSAIRDYDKAIEIAPNYAMAFNNRGLAYVDKKDYATAIRDFSKAIEIAPDLAVVFYNRGTVYAENKKNYDAAIRDFNKAIKLDPNFAMAFYNRGLVYKNKGNYDAAIRDYNKAIKLDPNFAMAMANMGLAYKEKGDKENARIWWEKALERQKYLPDGGEAVRRWLKELEE